MCYSGEIVVPRPKIVKKFSKKKIKIFSKNCEKLPKNCEKLSKKMIQK
jgi:hypothetical protein